MSATTRSALAATVLAAPVITEITWPALFDNPSGHLLFAGSQLLGWALLARLVAGAPPAARIVSPRGQRVVLAGCALQILFAMIYGATAFDGAPLEASFVAFMLGFLALLIGGLLWAVRLRSLPNGRVAATGLCGVALLGALAILVGIDPFHDICLVSSYAAWIIVGRGFDTIRSSSTNRDHNGSTPTSSRDESELTDTASAKAESRRA